MKTLIQKDIYNPMFIAALFTIAKIWKQPVSINRWMYKEDVVCMYTHTHAHTMKYYSAIKKNEILSFVTTWMDSGYYAKWNKSEKNKYCMFSLMCRM